MTTTSPVKTLLTDKALAVAHQQLDYILLDGSSSMSGQKWFETCAAIDAYVDGTRSQHIQSQILLATFDSTNVDCLQKDVSILDWRPLAVEPIGSYWGMTPLYDAINAMCCRLRDLNPARASIVICTDGDENASKATSLVQAKALLDWCRAKGWQVTFIGANFNNDKQASLLGANSATAIGVEQRHLVDAAKSLAKKRARYALDGTPMHWADDEKRQFGGYLSAPSK